MKNRENRVDVAMQSTLADGNYFFDGQVTNISRNGLKISGLPCKFSAYAKAYTTIVSAQGKSFRLQVEPSWLKSDGLNQDIGFKIISSPVDWDLHLNTLDPPDRDLWNGG
ncbi:MAG: hypothetical protein ABFR97_05925 [Thermodesulfobacteriota bacterium]